MVGHLTGVTLARRGRRLHADDTWDALQSKQQMLLDANGSPRVHNDSDLSAEPTASRAPPPTVGSGL